MKYYSTNHKTSSVELSEAVTRGLAPDGGLFMPERIAQLPQVFFDNLADMSFVEMSQRVARALLPGVAADECVMIGDSLTADIAGGKNAGMKTIWYNHAHRPVPEHCAADQIVDSLLELKTLL